MKQVGTSINLRISVRPEVVEGPECLRDLARRHSQWRVFKLLNTLFMRCWAFETPATSPLRDHAAKSNFGSQGPAPQAERSPAEPILDTTDFQLTICRSNNRSFRAERTEWRGGRQRGARLDALKQPEVRLERQLDAGHIGCREDTGPSDEPRFACGRNLIGHRLTAFPA